MRQPDRNLIVSISASWEQIQGGIIIPDSAKEKPQEAEILAVGNGKRLDDGTIVPLDVKAGDKVLIGKYAGTEITVDGEGDDGFSWISSRKGHNSTPS